MRNDTDDELHTINENDVLKKANDAENSSRLNKMWENHKALRR